MKPWKTLAQSGVLKLQERDGELCIRSDGIELMSSRRSVSEQAMAKYATKAKSVLIGGLGLGFTLGAVLEQTSAPEVVIAELSPAVVEWNRDILKRPAMTDPRVRVHVGDVGKVTGNFDSILIDVDNGPRAVSHPGNSNLYTPKGIARFKGMLNPKGHLVFWAAGPGTEEGFVKILGRAGFETSLDHVAGHTLFVARRRAS
ncbi:MAG: hypothetical protein JNK82_44720 [Myxococcaceae bacterium]|nr:hypothetical protein [Myxococcaceae bacterium]